MANGGIIGTVNNPTSTTATGVWQQEEQYEAVRDGTWPQRALFTTKSCRFNSASNDHLNRTQTAGNRRKFTFSTWVKRCNPATRMSLFLANRSASNYDQLYLNESGYLEADFYHSGTQIFRYKTNALYRDPSAWYHMIMAVDTEHDTASSRVRIYVNGLEVTSFSTETNPSENVDTHVNENSIVAYIGSDYNSNEPDYYLAETVMIDGQQLAPTSFGVANSDGVWTPIPYTGTFGTNGFNLQFENAAALGTDSSPNGNTFTVNNLTSIDQSTDYPVVNYATWNPLRTQAGYTKVMSEGNCVWEHGQAGQNASIPSTMAASSGKWYAEFLCSTSANNWGFGIAQVNVTNNGSMAGYPDSQGGVTYLKDGRLAWYAGGDQSSDTGTTYGTNDIIGILMDLDNTRVYWYKNDTLVNSGGFNYSVVNSGSTLENNYYFMAGATDDGTNPIIKANFGGSSGFAISSGNTDANGYGNFEFATKGGYALNTANLAEFG